MKKAKDGRWRLLIKSGAVSTAALLVGKSERLINEEVHKITPPLHQTFHPTKGFGYKSRRGKRNNGTRRRRG